MAKLKSPLQIPATCALLAFATAIVYWPVTHFGFINYDDPPYVTANPHVLAGLTWKSIAWAFTSAHSATWHPLTGLSHMMDIQLFGLNPQEQHAVNVVFHVCNTILLFLVSGNTGRSVRRGRALSRCRRHRPESDRSR
jgi:hypothetical protein